MPADELTPEQRAFWDEYDFDLPPEDLADGQQQFVGGMQYVYSWDGYPEPSAEALWAEVARRREGKLPGGGYMDLPFESGSATPEPLHYLEGAQEEDDERQEGPPEGEAMKISPVAKRDAALREFIETHSYFDEATGELYAPDDVAPPEIYDPEGDEDAEEDLEDE